MLESAIFFGKYEEVLGNLELSINKYSLPVRREDILGIYEPMFSPEHKGEFAPAIDFAVADPRNKETSILSPCDGVVVSGILHNTKWGEMSEDKKYLNWVHIKTGKNEFFELAHIMPIERRILRVGDMVKRGEVIAVAGLNGRMTKTQGVVDSHVHMYVGRYDGNSLRGLKVNWAV